MRRIALVFAGGFCGTLARYYLSAPLLAIARALLPGAHAGFPYDILAINLSGACALGLLYGLVERGASLSPDLRLTLGTGFLGAYTTFSSLAVGGDKLFTGGQPWASLLYCVGSIALGVLCARAGYMLAAPQLSRAALAARLRALGNTSTAGSVPLAGSRPSRAGARGAIQSRGRAPRPEMVLGPWSQHGSGEEDEIVVLAEDDDAVRR